MKQNILNTIEELYHSGDFGYVLFNYVDTNIWANKFNLEFKDIQVDNLTDFNYSKCFTLYIQYSELTKMKFGTDEFSSYIKEKNI